MYYTLKLNNTFDEGVHYISSNHFTIVPNVITKEVSDLSYIKDDMMDLDDTIIETEESYIVSGSFPVIARESNGIIYDAITNKVIKEAADPREVNGLSYRKKYKADSRMAELLLSNLTEEEIKNYVEYMEKLEEYSKKVFYLDDLGENFYILTPNNVAIDTDKVLVKEMNGALVEVVTKKRFFEINHRTVTSNLSFYDKYPISREEAMEYALHILENDTVKYVDVIREARKNSVRKYNNYVATHKDIYVKSRTLHK